MPSGSAVDVRGSQGQRYGLDFLDLDRIIHPPESSSNMFSKENNEVLVEATKLPPFDLCLGLKIAQNVVLQFFT